VRQRGRLPNKLQLRPPPNTTVHCATLTVVAQGWVFLLPTVTKEDADKFFPDHKVCRAAPPYAPTRSRAGCGRCRRCCARVVAACAAHQCVPRDCDAVSPGTAGGTRRKSRACHSSHTLPLPNAQLRN
jgi:hypothetical protein